MNRRWKAVLAPLALLMANEAYAAQCTYEVEDDWGSGYRASVTIHNDGAQPIEGWNVSWTLTESTITNSWEAVVQGSGTFTATNMPYNGTIAPGASVTFGFQGLNGPSQTAERPSVQGPLCDGIEPPPPTVGAYCEVDYTLVSNHDWPNAAELRVQITNLSDADINGWNLAWDLGPGESFRQGWRANFSGTTSIVATNTQEEPIIAANGGTQWFNFHINRGSDPAFIQRVFRLNGQYCGDSVGLDNPFENARWYVNPAWRDHVLQAGTALGVDTSSIAQFNTGVWLDSAAAVSTLRTHLDQAVADNRNLIVVVIYNLPNRDCSANASNGDWMFDDNGLQLYQSQFIDPIAEILADPRYFDLRIVTVIEPDSLPNLVTNVTGGANTNEPDGIPACDRANVPGDGYVAGIQYALDAFASIPNVYSYLDIGNSGWLGWGGNFDMATQLYADLINGTAAGFDSIAGFIANTSGYSPLEEPYVPQIPNWAPGGAADGGFYEWNPYNSELQYVLDWHDAMVNTHGLPASIGMLIDTSRNGWGGPDRPTGVATSGTTIERVNASRIDRRTHRGSWCNQPGGLGHSPTASPQPNIDAFLWVKPPGESDGISVPGVDIVNGRDRYDEMCDPTQNLTIRELNGLPIPTGAVDAPAAGQWNLDHFQILLENAFPALPRP